MSDTTSEVAPAAYQRVKGAKYWIRRTVIGLVGAIGTLMIVFSGDVHGNPGIPVALALAALALIGAHEFFRAVRQREKAEPTEWIAYVACVAFQVFAMFRSAGLDEYREVVIAFLIVTALLAELVKPRRTPIENIGATLIGALYVGWLLSFFTLIRIGHYPFILSSPAYAWVSHLLTLIHVGHYPFMGAPIANTESGAWMMIYIVATTWAGDIGAMCTGYVLGRRKLAPAISPAKTLEGAIGGIACSIAFAIVVGRLIGVPSEHAAALGILIGGIGLLGDLCESAMKRELGIKDFGKFFGNHGGMLDRCDSLLFTGPVAYYYMLLLLHQ